MHHNPTPAPSSPSSAMPVLEIESFAEFRAIVRLTSPLVGPDHTEMIDGDTPVVIDFWAPWSGPSRFISPVFENLSDQQEYANIGFYKVNIDDQPDIAEEVGLRVIPFFVAFHNGSKVGEITGANPDALKRDCPSPGASHKHPNTTATAKKRTSGLAYADYDSDESEYSEEEDVDATVKARGQNQKRPVGRATKSKAGHGHGRAQSGNGLMSQYPGHSSKGEQEREKEKEREREHGRAQSSLGFNIGPLRPRTSASTRAITPSGAVKKGSVRAAANSAPQLCTPDG
ncbi:hypothetical protein DXG01_008805 [Tephrocybe rancida]|nr:hypothetical protein DXG01_008805 [Tephrocybe rancida]